MGIVRNQSIKSSAFSYAGVFIGFINNVFILTSFLSTRVVGLIFLIRSFSGLFSQVSLLSVEQSTIKFFPQFKNKEEKHHGFLFFSSVLTIIGFTFFSILIFLFKEKIIQVFTNDSDLFVTWFNFVFPVTLAMIYTLVFSSYLRALYKTAYAAFVNEVLLRVMLIAAILLYYSGMVNFNGFLILFTLTYIICPLVLVAYIIFLKELHLKPDFSIITQELRKKIKSFSAISYINGISGRMMLEVDKLMVGAISSIENTAIYGVGAIIGTVITVPQKALNQISAPLVSESFTKGNIDKVRELYQKTSINQLITGIFIFLLIWLNIDELLSFLKSDYSNGKFVILFIAITKLVDMASGINSLILIYSRYYIFNFIFKLTISVLTVGLYLVMIPAYGINGAAIATLISFLSFNLVKLIFIYFKLKMQPFSLKTLLLLVISAIVFLLVSLVPDLGNPFVNILIKSGIIVTLYPLIILKLKISDDIGQFLRDLKARFLNN